MRSFTTIEVCFVSTVTAEFCFLLGSDPVRPTHVDDSLTFTCFRLVKDKGPVLYTLHVSSVEHVPVFCFFFRTKTTTANFCLDFSKVNNVSLHFTSISTITTPTRYHSGYHRIDETSRLVPVQVADRLPLISGKRPSASVSNNQQELIKEQTCLEKTR